MVIDLGNGVSFFSNERMLSLGVAALERDVAQGWKMPICMSKEQIVLNAQAHALAHVIPEGTA